MSLADQTRHGERLSSLNGGWVVLCRDGDPADRDYKYRDTVLQEFLELDENGRAVTRVYSVPVVHIQIKVERIQGGATW